MNKLLELQKKIPAILKEETNPFFKSKYFDINKVIEVLKPILNELNLILIQPLTYIDNGVETKPALRTCLIDAETNKKILEDITILPANPKPQEQGKNITYFRRYSLTSMLLLQGEEDTDGNINK